MRPADLRARRQALRLSQAGLGQALGVARNTVAAGNAASWRSATPSWSRWPWIALKLRRSAPRAGCIQGPSTQQPASRAQYIRRTRRGACRALPPHGNGPTADSDWDRWRGHDARGHSTRARGQARLSRRRRVCRPRAAVRPRLACSDSRCDAGGMRRSNAIRHRDSCSDPLGRRRILLVLDNGEHLLEECGRSYTGSRAGVCVLMVNLGRSSSARIRRPSTSSMPNQSMMIS